MTLFIVCTVVRVIKSKRLKWTDNVARMEQGRSSFKILTGTSAGKKPLGRIRLRWRKILE